MAGEWMKVELDLPGKPEVLMVAGMLGITADAVVGKLIKVWGWASRNCNGDGVTHVTVLPFLNELACANEFTNALEKCGWLRVENDVVTFVNFNRHMSQTAKERALTNMRVSRHRRNAHVTEKKRSHRYKNVTREEKKYTSSKCSAEAAPGGASAQANGISKNSKVRI
jgi:hypothetical protein